MYKCSAIEDASWYRFHRPISLNTLDFHWGCSSAPLVEWVLPYDLRWWVMGVRKHSMYRRCLQLAWWRMEPILCVGKGVLPNLRTVPTSGRLSFFSPNSFFLWNAKSKLPPWCGGIKEYTLSWPERIMARSKLLFTTSCTMKCCESESAMMKEIIHEQMKMFWQNFSLQV